MYNIVGKHVLIVEDNGLIGEVIAESISQAGGWPLGPVLSEVEALDIINYNPGRPDAAILDLRIDGSALGVAERLQDLGVPFVFATGHVGELPERLRAVRVCEKPYTAQTLLRVLHEAIESAGPRVGCAR